RGEPRPTVWLTPTAAGVYTPVTRTRGPEMSFGDESGIDFDTARGRDWPSVRQFNVFLANRMGALLELVRRFETTDVKLGSLLVVETADCAIIRLVTGDPERAYEILKQAKLPFTE